MVADPLARREQQRAQRREQGNYKAKIHRASAVATQKPITSGTASLYKNALKELTLFLDEYKDQTDIESNVQHAKRFIIFFVEGRRGYNDVDGAVCATTVNTFWKSFCAARQRAGFPRVSNEVNHTIANLISGNGTFDQGLTTNRKHSYHHDSTSNDQGLRLGRTRRVKKNFTQHDFFVVSSQLWQNDAYDFQHERYRLGLHLLLLLHCGTSARAGEFEGNLRWQDFTLSAVWFADRDTAQFVLDFQRKHLKAAEYRPGLSEKQQPQHAFYELIDEQYYLNAVAFFIAAALADGVIVGYHSWSDLCNIPQPAGLPRVKLDWHPTRKHWYLFPRARKETLDHERPSTHLANSALVKLGFRAGFQQPLTLHAVRREILFKVDNSGHSVDNRMRLAGHTSASTFGQFYQSDLCIIDGLAAFLNLEAHSGEYHELRRGFAFDKIDAIGSTLTSTAMRDLNASVPLPDIDSSAEKRYKIYEERRDFLRQRMGQRSQPNVFQTSSRFMSSRRTLARLLFTQGSLRSASGREVMDHLTALCVQPNSETFCKSLNSDSTTCETCKRTKKLKAQWEQHVYACRRRKSRREGKFTEFCFLCFSWFDDRQVWENHVRSELTTLEADCSLRTFRYMTLRPGLCPVCLFDEDCAMIKRFHQFRNSNKWRSHIQSHLTKSCVLQCRHRACAPPIVFDSLDQYKEHLLKVHQVDLKPVRVRRARTAKRSRDADSGDLSADETSSDIQDDNQDSDDESCSSAKPRPITHSDSASDSEPASHCDPCTEAPDSRRSDDAGPPAGKRRRTQDNTHEALSITTSMRRPRVISVNIPRLSKAQRDSYRTASVF